MDDFGSVTTHVSYDMPAALNVNLREWLGIEYEEWQYKLNLLYTAYSLPNTILPLLGGILSDRLGPSLTLTVFSTMVLSGQILFALGVHLRLFPLMLVGRCLFGVGSETVDVAQVSLATEWFSPPSTLPGATVRPHNPALPGLALAVGINLAFVRSSTALNDIASPWIAQAVGVQWAPVVGAICCTVSALAVVLVSWMDRKEGRERAGVPVRAAQAVKRRRRIKDGIEVVEEVIIGEDSSSTFEDDEISSKPGPEPA
ncbi:hypothetical protein HDU93_000718, partial [Gonapodya sp. JEL0774]